MTTKTKIRIGGKLIRGPPPTTSLSWRLFYRSPCLDSWWVENFHFAQILVIFSPHKKFHFLRKSLATRCKKSNFHPISFRCPNHLRRKRRKRRRCFALEESVQKWECGHLIITNYLFKSLGSTSFSLLNSGEQNK